ncbi:PQQ-binding-like beta-propeller repeat protein [Nocardia sp. NPDC059240]|uniref:outer membrane protein assembly factor BamB family protein n=1 Tax=Nocardia sp. NPDC059240 TaxID=3346786 RepID=UPI0036A890D4
MLRGGAILIAAGAAGCAVSRSAVVTAAAGTIAWKYQTDGRVRGLRAATGRVVVESETGLAGLDDTSGRELWRAPFSTPGIATGACFWSDALVVCETGPDAVNRAVAVDLATGQRKWSFDAPDGAALVGAFGIRDGVLYLIAADHDQGGREIWAVDLRAESVRWRVPCPADGLVVPDGGLLYSRGTAGGGEIAAFDPGTGATVWSRAGDPGISGTTIGSGLVDGAVLATDGLHTVSGLDPKTGAALWTTPALPYPTDVLFGGGDVYYLSDGDKLHAMRPGGDAAPLWSLGVSDGGRAGKAGGYAADGICYLLADKTLRAIEAHTGKVRWMQEIPDKAGSEVPFAVGDGYCSVESAEGDGAAVVAFAR